jgi:hypothetical protein
MVRIPYYWIVLECGVGIYGGKRTVNRKDMGVNIRAYGGRILFGFQSCGT